MAISRKPLENTYKLPNINRRLERDEVERALQDPEYMMGNFSQIVNKGTQTVPFVWNDFQREMNSVFMPLVNPSTRLNRKHYVIVVKPRQVGASTGNMGIWNHTMAFAEGINNLNLLHILPVQGTLTALARDKVEPIITGIHPNLFPEIYKKNDNGTIVYEYDNIKGNKRNNIYQLVSSNTKAIRGTTNHIVLFDEVAFYNRPEELEAAVLPSIPSYGFSLVVYLSTFEDNKNTFFLDKIRTAIANPEDYTLIFVPWYKIYPETPDRRNIDFDTVELTEYDREVIIPEFQKNNFPRERWGDAIDWYHRTSAGFKAMKKEFPTTLDELLEAGRNEPVFSQQAIDWQKQHEMKGHMYSLNEDVGTKKLSLSVTDVSPIKVFQPPIMGHRYMLCVDPITAIGENTDNFAATMMDMSNYEQVATIHGRGLLLEDWASYSVGLCKIYNNAQICPEINVGGEFVAYVRGHNYHRFWYSSEANRANKVPGLRTTASTKEGMIRALNTLLDNHRIILHDPVWIQELEDFELKKKIRSDQTVVVKMEARSGKHDDCHAKGTMILTDKGEVPIEKIKPGDMVLTRKGYRKVISTSKRVKPCIERFGKQWSPDHPVIMPTKDKKFQYLDIHDTIYTWEQKLSNIKGRNIADTQIQKEDICESTIGTMEHGKNLQSPCTHKFGKTIMGKFLKVILSIIKMATHKIMTSLILNVLHKNSTWQNIIKILNGHEKLEPNYLKQVGIDQYGLIDVKTVKKSLNLKGRLVLDFVQGCVRIGIMPRWARTYTTMNGNVNVVINLFKLLNTEESSVTSATKGERTLYALNVEDAHEYFADGVLVHNCTMSLAVFAGTLRPTDLVASNGGGVFFL